MESLLSIINIAQVCPDVKLTFHFYKPVPFLGTGSHIRGQPLIEYSVLRKGALPMEDEAAIRRYEEAARVLPGRLRGLALSQPQEVRRLAEEFRLRAGRPLAVLLPEGCLLYTS